jgi:hypothetical protein
MAAVQLQRDDLFHKASTLTQQVRRCTIANDLWSHHVLASTAAMRLSSVHSRATSDGMSHRWRGCRRHWRPRTGASRTCAQQRPPATRSARRCRSSRRWGALVLLFSCTQLHHGMPLQSPALRHAAVHAGLIGWRCCVQLLCVWVAAMLETHLIWHTPNCRSWRERHQPHRRRQRRLSSR